MNISSREFYIKCLHSAFPKSIAQANSWKWLYGAPVLVLILYVANINSITTGHPPLDLLLGTAAALLVTWITVFLFRCIKAPIILYREKESEIAVLLIKLDDKEKRQAAINQLWKLRSKGVSLRNEFPDTEETYRAWEPRFFEWRDEVLLEAEKVSPNLKEWLARLDILSLDARSLPSPFKQVQNMSEILIRLAEYLKTEVFKNQPSCY